MHLEVTFISTLLPFHFLFLFDNNRADAKLHSEGGVIEKFNGSSGRLNGNYISGTDSVC